MTYGKKILLFILCFSMLTAGCNQIKAGFQSPMPPAERLGLTGEVMDSGNIGGKSIHFGWTPPKIEDGIDYVVIEKGLSKDGPWEEIAVARPESGSYEEKGSIFRGGKIYYFRIFTIRGGDKTQPTEALQIIIPK